MVRYSFVFFVVFLIGVFTSLSGQYATSVIPGWHISISPPLSLISVYQILWLGLVSVLYLFLEKKGRIVNRKIFILHILFSVSMFLNNTYMLIEWYFTSRFLLIAPLILFLIGQIIFIIGALKAKRTAVDQKIAIKMSENKTEIDSHHC
jgi:hypothetical protein